MNKTLKSILKFLVWTCFFVLAFIFGLNIWLGGIWEKENYHEYLAKLTTDIKSTQPLPDNFFETSQKVQPEIFDSAPIKKTVGMLFFDKRSKSCACSQVIRSQSTKVKWVRSKPRYYHGLQVISIARELGTRVTQKQCYAYWLNNYDFYSAGWGIQKASETYFNKSLEALTLDQQIELLVIMKGQGVYDRIKHPERVKKEVERLKEKIIYED